MVTNCLSPMQHHISNQYTIPHSSPIFCKPYLLPHAAKNEINRQVSNMKSDGIIEDSKSPWNFPLKKMAHCY